MVDELFTPLGAAERSNPSIRRFLFGLFTQVKVEPRQWVIVVQGAGLAMRNIDHLLLPDSAEIYPPANLDFYWSHACKEGCFDQRATPGFWAARGEFLPLVLERLESALNGPDAQSCSEEEIWTGVVQELPLRKRAFEKGEVVAPLIGAVDWEAVSNAAFVTVADWPEKEAWKFLQALYFGTYLGDETGMMLNILEA